MQYREENGLKWLEFDLLADIKSLRHAIFLRHGGISQGPFASLNVSTNCGDKQEHVQFNLNKICKHFQQQIHYPLKLHWAKQCHGKEISHVSSVSSQILTNCDALMTAVPGVALMINHADCQAAIFYDPLNQAIANVHAGWRGNVLNIYEETIQAMRHTFGTHPSNLLVCISPSLGPAEAEFINYTQELPYHFWEFQITPTYFDFWAISEYQLQRAGILPHHIEIARISTYADEKNYFSYRRDQLTGRHGTCVTLI